MKEYLDLYDKEGNLLFQTLRRGQSLSFSTHHFMVPLGIPSLQGRSLIQAIFFETQEIKIGSEVQDAKGASFQEIEKMRKENLLRNDEKRSLSIHRQHL